ncbi:MAG TPA: glycosyltransferase family 2 protein [Blastocatellia bacterium]|nr:glycosyltransferase family 2 protein [Blastocatellia bacterium]
MSDSQPDVSIVVVSFNTRDCLRECLNTLAAQAGGVSYETIVVDNASKDGSAEMIEKEFPEAKLIRSDVNLGFAAANNRGFEFARGRYIVLLNSDAFLKPGALPLSVEKMDANPGVGLAGARLIGRDGEWQPSARMFPSFTNDFLLMSGLSTKYSKSKLFGRVDRTWADPNAAAEVDWVPGAYSIIRREALQKAGCFDERFFLYFEEVDLCRRIKAAGYSLWYWPDIVVVHIGGESSKTVSHLSMSKSGSQLTLWRMRAELLYYRKHHGLTGAWLAKELESMWHGLRASKNAKSPDPERQAKAKDSGMIVSLMKQAWKDTSGGQVSPPRPW